MKNLSPPFNVDNLRRIRIGKEEEREVVYLTRLDIRSLYYFFLLS
jgi:hypothetical protein